MRIPGRVKQDEDRKDSWRYGAQSSPAPASKLCISSIGNWSAFQRLGRWSIFIGPGETNPTPTGSAYVVLVYTVQGCANSDRVWCDPIIPQGLAIAAHLQTAVRCSEVHESVEQIKVFTPGLVSQSWVSRRTTSANWPGLCWLSPHGGILPFR